MNKSLSRSLSHEELEKFGAEIEALRAATVAKLGARDARYIRNIHALVRWSEMLGRVLLMVGFFLPTAWLIAFWVFGVLSLALSKIVDNMELGHNVIHGQFDWMGDPHFNGKSFEWDIVGTSGNWRKTHNFRHHTYTNIHGLDDDIGYGVLRLFPEQRWSFLALLQPVYAVVFALLFQWGVAIQDLRLGQLFGKRRKSAWAELRRAGVPVLKKIGRQLFKDYLLFPLLAGPGFWVVFTGNLVANGLRNIWTYVIIFCGHFTTDVETFPKGVIKNETRAHWYWRQIRGSSNISGGFVLNTLSGNLSHQIEHHLFPDVPANRYVEMAPVVRDICKRYGIHYNTGSFASQFAQVVWRILRHALPSRPQTTRLAGAQG